MGKYLYHKRITDSVEQCLNTHGTENGIYPGQHNRQCQCLYNALARENFEIRNMRSPETL